MIAGDPADWDDFFQRHLIPAVLALVISTWDQMEKPEQTAHEDDISLQLFCALKNSKDAAGIRFSLAMRTWRLILT